MKRLSLTEIFQETHDEVTSEQFSNFELHIPKTASYREKALSIGEQLKSLLSGAGAGDDVDTGIDEAEDEKKSGKKHRKGVEKEEPKDDSEEGAALPGQADVTSGNDDVESKPQRGGPFAPGVGPGEDAGTEAPIETPPTGEVPQDATQGGGKPTVQGSQRPEHFIGPGEEKVNMTSPMKRMGKGKSEQAIELYKKAEGGSIKWALVVSKINRGEKETGGSYLCHFVFDCASEETMMQTWDNIRWQFGEALRKVGFTRG